MRWPIALLLSSAAVVSCGGPVASVRPSAPGTPRPVATATAPATATPAATAARHVHRRDRRCLRGDDARPWMACSRAPCLSRPSPPTVHRRPITTLSGITAGLPVDSTIVDGEPILVSPTGFLTLVVEGPFDEPAGADDPVARRLVVDLRNARPERLWSPRRDRRRGVPTADSRSSDADGATVVDPATAWQRRRSPFLDPSTSRPTGRPTDRPPWRRASTQPGTRRSPAS